MARDTFHHGDLRASALAAARERVAESGVEKLALREVAAVAGVNHRALYRHFPDKQALILELAAAEVNALVDAIDERVARAAAGGRPKALIEAYVHFAFEQPRLYEMVFSLPLRDEFDADTQVGVAVKRLIKACGDAFEQPGDTDAQTRNRVLQAWGAAHGLVLLIFRGALRVGARAATERYIVGTSLGLNK
jgi:AcrR family transcriptional regulator